MRDLLNSQLKKIMFKNTKIKNRLTFTYSVLILLSIFSVSIFSYNYSRNIITEKSMNYALGILEQVTENVDINLEQIDKATYMILSDDNILSILQYGKSMPIYNDLIERTNVQKILTNVSASRSDIDSIYLFDNDGNLYGANVLYSHPEFKELKAFAETGDGKMVWLDTDKKNDIIPAVRLIRGRNMEKIGVLLVNVRKKVIDDVISKRITNINGEFYVINVREKIISCGNNDLIGNKFDSNILSKIGENEVNAINTPIKFHGEKSIIGIYLSRFNDWKYVYTISTNNLFAEVTYLRNINIMSSVFFLILFIIISLLIAHSITEPIKQIADHMKNVRIKDWSPRIEYSGNDEIVYLSDAFNNMVQKINTLIVEVYEQKLIEKEQELKILQAQINPHFLYNTLDIINWMARTRNVPEIGKVVKSLSNIMRYTINQNRNEVSIGEEISNVMDYCMIQGLRYGERLKVTYNVHEDIMEMQILKLTLQPIVENAFVHGFKNKEDECILEIAGMILDDKICITIKDNGMGIGQSKLDSILDENACSHKGDSGIAVINVHRRLGLKYGKGYGLEIVSTLNEGTIVKVWLPVD